MKHIHLTLKKGILVIITTIILLLIVLMLLLVTNPGLQLAVHILDSLAPNHNLSVKIPEAKGNLLHFYLPEVHIQSATENIQISGMTVRTNPIALIWQHLDLRELQIKTININTIANVKSTIVEGNTKGSTISTAKPLTPPAKRSTSLSPLFPHFLLRIHRLHIGDINGFKTLKHIRIEKGEMQFKDQQASLNQLTLVVNQQEHFSITGQIQFDHHKTLATLQVHGIKPAFDGQLQADVNYQHSMSQLNFNSQWDLPHIDPITLSFSTLINSNILNLKHLKLSTSAAVYTGNGTISWKPSLKWQFTLAPDLITNMNIPALSIRSTGNINTQDLYLQMAFHQIHIESHLSTNLLSQSIPKSATIETFNINLPFNTWKLASPAPISLASKTLGVPHFCFGDKELQWCGGITYNLINQRLNTQVKLTPLITRLKNTQGAIDGFVNFKPKAKGKTHQLSISVEHIPLKQPDYLFNRSIFLDHFKFDLKGNSSATQSKISLQVNKKNHLTAQLLTNYNSDGIPPSLRGSYKAEFSSLRWLNSFIAPIYKLNGQLDAEGSITGAISKPQIRTQIHLSNGTFVLPKTGITVENIDLAIANRSATSWSLTGTAKSGKGQLLLDSQMTYSAESGFHLNGNIKGYKVTLYDLPNGNLIASPDLNISLSPLQQKVTGSITLDDATFFIDNSTLSTHNTDDINFTRGIRDSQISNTIPWLYNIDLFIGAKPLHINDSIGLDVKLNGAVNFSRKKPEQHPSALGQLNLISGTFAQFGKTFVLKEGKVLYNNNPIDNPSLDITAEYKPGNEEIIRANSNLQVGVRIVGNAQKPVVQLFSIPPMSQADILSFIVLGQPLDQINQGGESALTSAALQYALLSGSNNVLNQITQHIGITQVGFGSLNPYSTGFGDSSTTTQGPSSSKTTDQNDQNNNTALFIGRPITNRIYVSYGVGLFNSTQEVVTKLFLNKNWSVLASHSTIGSGVDLLLHFYR